MIRLVSNPYAYQGLSTDTNLVDVAVAAGEGSTYHETDTGKSFVFHNGEWVEDTRLQYAFLQALEAFDWEDL